MGDPTCKNCGVTLAWKKPYVQGEPPVNADGTKHTCDAPQGLAERKTGAPSPEVPIEQIIDEIGKIRAICPEGGSGIDTMIEGIWKYTISRKMRR